MRRRRSSATSIRRRRRQQVSVPMSVPASIPVSIPWPDISNFIFDVEGTLVDAVMPTLQCWRATLQEHGHFFALADLHQFCGMDGKDMLKQLLPTSSGKERERLLESQGRRYREQFLPLVRPLPGVLRLFEQIKARGCLLGLATDCQRDQLDHYLALTGVAPLIDAVASGSQVKRGKPHPDLLYLALRLLKAKSAATVMVGDTPYDAEAARRLNVWAVGVMSGHFPAHALRAAGCREVFRDSAALYRAILAPADVHQIEAKAS
jgi:HAD superfamily hydrolase (TIGR01509 family)